jgi:Tetratricopeptide repeat
MPVTRTNGEASVGAAVITRDALEPLKRLLAQLAHLDQVVVVDFRWRGRPGAHGPDDWGFAAARNKSFSHIRTTHCIWVDSDDTVVAIDAGQPAIASPDGLVSALHALIEEWPAADVWLMDYVYQTDELGTPTSVTMPERLLKMEAGWRWRYPIHEVLVPTREADQIWAVDVREVAVLHKSGDVPASERRNRPMQRAWLRQLLQSGAPNSELARPRWLIGRSLRMRGRYLQAARWLRDEYLARHPELSATERWEGWMDVARSALLADDARGAREAALTAIESAPGLPEAYVLLADVMAANGDPAEDILKLLESAESRSGDTNDQPQRNPGYLGFTTALLRAESNLRLGRHAAALPLAARALEIRPGDPRARRALDHASGAAPDK